MRLQPSCCFAGNSMLSQDSHCTNRIAGSRPVVPCRTRQDRAQSLAIGRAKHAVAAVESRNLLERAVLAPRKISRQCRFGEGAEWQAAGERQPDLFIVNAPCAGRPDAERRRRSWPAFSPDARQVSRRFRNRPDIHDFRGSGGRLAAVGRLAKPRRRHAHAGLECTVEGPDGTVSDAERDREHGKPRFFGPAQALTGFANAACVQEVIEVAIAEAPVDDPCARPARAFPAARPACRS